MKAKYKLSATERANYNAYKEYDSAQRALFRLAYGLGSNAIETIDEAGAYATYTKLCDLMRAHLKKKESTWDAICIANPNDNDCIGA